jgi:hypothetical protein
MIKSRASNEFHTKLLLINHIKEGLPLLEILEIKVPTMGRIFVNITASN